MFCPVASWTKQAICSANLLPPAPEPAHTQNSARLNSTNSLPVLGNRDKTGAGFNLNSFVIQSNQDFIFNLFHSLGSVQMSRNRKKKKNEMKKRI